MERLTRRVGTWAWVIRHWLIGEPELRVLPALFDRPGRFVDVGANNGVYSLTASRFADRVVAFEPHPALAANLRVILRRWGEVRQLALSDRAGRSSFSVPVESGADHHTRGSLLDAVSHEGATRTFEVETGRLDDEGLEDVVVLKIDVEGHEAAVLRGARELLASGRPSVIVEVEERHSAGALDEVFTLMRGERYSGWFVSRGELLPVETFNRQQHQVAELAPDVRQRTPAEYINNFIWLPVERPALVTALKDAMTHSTPRTLWTMTVGRRGRPLVADQE